MTHDTHADHDEFGGLHATVTPAAIDRRGLLRLMARFGVAGRAATDGLRLERVADVTDNGTVTGTSSSCPSRVPSERKARFRAMARMDRTC
jgi:hypothetical protein